MHPPLTRSDRWLCASVHALCHASGAMRHALRVLTADAPPPWAREHAARALRDALDLCDGADAMITEESNATIAMLDAMRTAREVTP